MRNIWINIICLAAGYVIPLLSKPELIVNNKIIILMLCCMVMLIWGNPTISLSENKVKYKNDRGSMLIIFVSGFICMTVPVIEWAYFNNPTITAWTFWTKMGFIMLFSGLIFRIWSLRILGKQFTAAVLHVEDHQLIISGPYRWLRHPSYTGSLVSFLGNAIFLEAWIGLVVTLVCMGTAYYYRIKVEEIMLDKIFGQSYQRYRQHSWCIIPFLW